MQQLGEQYTLKTTKAPHDLASIVDEIITVAGEHKTYNYKYWLGKVKRSKLTFNEILNLVEKAKGLDEKYNKGGFITKRL